MPVPGRRSWLALLGALVVLAASAATALGAPASRLVRYHGIAVAVPASWPVYDLSADPSRCVRFDLHALYLGTPGARERCPAKAVGRTEAILIEPLGPGAIAGVQALRSPLTLIRSIPRRGVLVTATWLHDRGTIDRALRGALSDPSARTAAASAAPPPAIASPTTHIFRGRGFDACTAPSTGDMSAWSSSPYRAIGIYIGGTNMACSQPNLTSGWVSTETSAGWRLIPTYVGLQAPNNNCGCASMSSAPRQAAAQGTAAANDAVNQARAIGIGSRNPIYDDMEGYNTGSPNTPAVLAFLQAWTVRLHQLGYYSGVYSSAGSGITDLVNQVGTGYREPNDVWFAEWNGLATTSSSYIPSGDWASHERLHQYNGGVDRTYGGVTINVDEDYLDGVTV